MVLCTTEQDPLWLKALVQAPSVLSLAISAFAFWVALKSYRYAEKKDAQSAARSVKDEFWIRTVVSPLSIAPFVSFATGLMTTLPGASASATAVRDYWKNHQSRLNELAGSFQALKLVDQTLHGEVEKALTKFEDLLSSYVSDLGAFLDGHSASAPSRQQAIAELGLKMIEVFRPIEQHQNAIEGSL